MNTPTTLGTFALGLLAAFGAALGVGTAVGPVGAAAPTMEHAADEPDMDMDMGADGHGDEQAPDAVHGDGAETVVELPGGLMVSQDGYTLDLAVAELPAGPQTPLSFQVLGPNGEPVTEYTQSHDKDLHLIAVRRDTTGFQHVHPDLDADGTWSAPLSLTGGEWRLFADFVPATRDDNLILGADLSVPGTYEPQTLPEPAATAQVDDYTVTLDGELVPGQESELTLSVSKDGEPVTDLQPYLAAYGHLVALRDGDLAYLHVHPAGEPGDGATAPGPDVTFYTTLPSTGTYRLFLDFKHDDVVRTAEFTVEEDR